MVVGTLGLKHAFYTDTGKVKYISIQLVLQKLKKIIISRKTEENYCYCCCFRCFGFFYAVYNFLYIYLEITKIFFIWPTAARPSTKIHNKK